MRNLFFALIIINLQLIILNIGVMNDRQVKTYITTTRSSDEWQLFCEYHNNDQGFDYTWVGYTVDSKACLDIYQVKSDLGLVWLEGQFE